MESADDKLVAAAIAAHSETSFDVEAYNNSIGTILKHAWICLQAAMMIGYSIWGTVEYNKKI